MKAGRELDALIAEKVMGWKLFRVGYCGTDDETPEQGKYEKALDRAGFDSVGWYVWTGGKVVLWEDGFTKEHCFSTNIADAWEVVEKLGRWRGFDFMLVMPDPEQTFHLHTYEAGWYEATNDGPERRVVSDADTAPLAICLAALKAVSQEGQANG